MTSRTALLTFVLLASLVGQLGAAVAAPVDERPVELRIEQLSLQPDGSTQMTVVVSGLPEGQQVSLDQLEVVENGEPVTDLTLASEEVEEIDSVTPAVVVAMDVSGSAEGEPIEAAKAAAVDLLGQLGENGVRTGAVSFGETTEVIAPLSADEGAAVAAIGALQASGATALYDGVSRAVRMLAGHDGPRDVVVFSDGEDTASTSDLDSVRGLLAQTEVRVTSVLLQTGGVAEEPLRAMSEVNGGRLITVGAASDIGDVFATVASDLTNRLVVTWTVDPQTAPAATLNVVATYATDAAAVSDGQQVENPRIAAVTPPREVETSAAVLPFLSGVVGRVTAAVATGLAVLLILMLVFVTGGVRRRRTSLDKRLAAYQPGVGEQGRDDRVSLSARAGSAFDSVPRPATLDSRIGQAIEHADWPMRVSEFLLLSLSLGVLGFLVGAVVVASAAAAAAGLLIGLSAPWIYLRLAVSRRRAAFDEQLPTVLQILAGALRAGHALSTALDGAVDEVDEPARSELRRASVEARLGRPLDRALGGVAKRMDSEDLQWVIGAIEVQREVGGNLAEILGNVAETLRDRASVKRQVQSLTAEGRLSAVVISAMPFAMFLLLTIINPEYMRLLVERPIGRLLLAGGFLLLLAGILVLRRLVRPRF